MIVSRKSAFFTLSLTPLYVDHPRLELVNSFKYLGVITSSNLSWSAIIHSVCAKSRQLALLESSFATSISTITS